ncbi:bacteriophage protein [Klebsiella michiganensis]|uniref:bacteriophage protein n=1 Tax=Klebsiella michiganensis TaxID=1134687 RepID=UPI000667AEDB|nr:bacteriophage protein [Klebsiella michiganensis]
MNAETLKDFLISLGFKVDEAGARKFDAVVAGTTLKAIELGVKVEATALSVVAFTAKIASGLDDLYWASQRTGATVEGIKQIGYAVSQVGGSVDGARGSLESLARFMRNNPGAEGFLNRLGVQTRDASGNMRDMATIFTGVGQRLSTMPYYRANQYAQMLGLDENTLMAMRRGIGQFSGEYNAIAKAIGYNADVAAVSSNKFMTSLRSFGLMAGMARDKIGSSLADGLAGSLDRLRRQILDNFPKIEGAITGTVKGILWAGEMVGRVIYRLIQLGQSISDWWDSLDKQSQELIELIGALTAAWWMLNRAMLASPITWVLGLAAAIALLWEDYQTWKEGGKSLIDWGKWKPEVDAALKMVGDLKQTVLDLGKALAKLLNIDPKSWSLKWDFSNFISQMGEFSKMLSMIGDLLNAIKDGRWSDAASIGRALLKQGSNQPDALPGVSDSANSAADWIKDKIGFDPRSIGRFFRGDGNTLADRNNNPGNIRPVGGGGFRAFGSALEGWEAMKNQLMRYFTGKTTGRSLQTIMDIVSTWAPAADNNDPAKYARDVAGWMGVSPTAALNLSDPNTMAMLMQSMARKEGYSNWNSPLAHQAAGAQVNQQNTYNIYGGNAQEIGQEVSRRQLDANARVLRNNQTGAG